MDGEMEIFGEQEPSHNCMDQYFVLIDDVVLHFIIIKFLFYFASYIILNSIIY